MVITPSGEIVWWGGVNWYSRRTQRACRVPQWQYIKRPDLSKCGTADTSFMETGRPASGDGERKAMNPQQTTSEPFPSCACSATPPFRVDGSAIFDANGDRVIVCEEDAEPCHMFSERLVNAEPWFKCPSCNRLGQRMVEATPEHCGLEAADGRLHQPCAGSSGCSGLRVEPDGAHDDVLQGQPKPTAEQLHWVFCYLADLCQSKGQGYGSVLQRMYGFPSKEKVIACGAGLLVTNTINCALKSPEVMKAVGECYT